jgi:hypothetical protein
MAKNNPHRLRLEMASELRQLAELLKGNLGEICPDVYPLYEASELCAKDTQDDFFCYKMRALNFRTGLLKKPIPSNLKDLTVSLAASVAGFCCPIDVDGIADVYDPLMALEFNLLLNGKYIDGGREKRAYCTWHLDRDIEEGRGNQNFMHPFYHFQHGGRMLDSGLRYGASLIIDMPRLAHPPMDAILGIDFVLTNFVGSSRIQDLRKNNEYRRIMRSAQARIWKPYVMTLARAWETENTPDWCAQTLYPQLIK